MSSKPVFIFAAHRSGSTMLERILNCHPNLVVWGEHGGLLNKFAELNILASKTWNVSAPLGERRLERFVAKQSLEEFDAWTNPMDVERLRSWTRSFLIETFSSGLKPGQRWGIKEIRYGGAALTWFLLNLFPDCRVLVLRRDLVQLCISNILAEWSLGELAEMGVTDAQADMVVADCAYAVAAVDWRLQRAAQAAGARGKALWLTDVPTAMQEVFRFLDLDLDLATAHAVGRIIQSPVGATNRTRRLGRIDEDFISAEAPRHLQAALACIDADGLDRARLLGLGGTGRFCFLVGDHSLRQTGLSSMGWQL